MEEKEHKKLQVELAPTHSTCGLCASVVKRKTLKFHLKGRPKKKKPIIRSYELKSHPLTHNVLCISLVWSENPKISFERKEKKNI